MNNKRVEQHLRNAISQLTPDIMDKVAGETVPKVDFDIGKTKRKVNYIGRVSTVLAACAVFAVLILGPQYFNINKIDSVIDIDVNPSIEITTNRKDRVIDVVALNDDAITIIDGMDLKKVQLNVAVNAIIGSMVKNGYISELDNSILVSVKNNDAGKAKELQELIVQDINNSLKENNVTGTVFNQQMDVNASLEELAEKYNISPGKAAFLLKLIELEPSFTMEELSKMSLREIADYVKLFNIDLHDIIDYEEDDSLIENIEEAIEDADEDYQGEDDDSDEDDDDDDDRKENNKNNSGNVNNTNSSQQNSNNSNKNNNNNSGNKNKDKDKNKDDDDDDDDEDDDDKDDDKDKDKDDDKNDDKNDDKDNDKDDDRDDDKDDDQDEDNDDDDDDNDDDDDDEQ